MTFPQLPARLRDAPPVVPVLPADAVPEADADGDQDGTLNTTLTTAQRQELSQPGGPLWWLQNLQRRLWAKQLRTRVFFDYYRGDHRLRFATAKFLETYGGLFNEFADNASRKVVDVLDSRLEVTGFRLAGDQKADADAWTWWQLSRMEEKSAIAHQQALIGESSAAGVWWGPDGQPQITVMDPRQVVVEIGDDGLTRVAALRQWRSPQTGAVHAVVWTPGRVWKFRNQDSGLWLQQHDIFLQAYNRPNGGAGRPGLTSGLILPEGYLRGATTWIPDMVEGEAWPLRHDLGVPVVPLVNRPDMTGEGESELRDIVPVQDALNKTMLDALVNSEFTAFTQRWYIGTVPRGDDGQPVSPFEAGPGRVAWTEDPAAKFGEFRESSGAHLQSLIETIVGHLALLSDIPGHYFAGLKGTQFPSGDALRAAEAGLTSKARKKGRSFGEAWLEVMRLCYLVRGRKTDLAKAGKPTLACLWRDPEEFTRSESAHLDALAKMIPLGVPGRLLRARAGVSPDEEDSIPALLVEQAKAQVAYQVAYRDAATAAGLAPAPVAAGGSGATGADPSAPTTEDKVVVPGEPGSPVGTDVLAARVRV